LKARPALRSSEWLLLAYFIYVAVLSAWFHPVSPSRMVPVTIAGGAVVIIGVLAAGERYGPKEFFSYARDWTPLVLTLTAYREMDWFTPKQYDHHFENAWIVWDRLLLSDWGLRGIIESTGPWLPGYFELCYALVYAVGPFTIAMVYAFDRRDVVDRVLVLYLLGTLMAYALFPYFPSGPPRTVFPEADLPRVMTPFREFNLWLLSGYGIHSSVFPSAHVSSAFAAAWALLLFLPERKRVGWVTLIYAVSVAIATVYGRYHYAADVVAGLGISVVAVIAGGRHRRT
jgi:membrane-associated phospholipid phosphatase